MLEQKLAYCGINCEECPVFIATVNNDNELREKTAQEWSDVYKDYLAMLGMNGLKPEDMNCRGCWSERDRFMGSMSCPMRKCSQERDLTTCAGCNDYEICDMLKGFYSTILHHQAKENLDRIRMKR